VFWKLRAWREEGRTEEEDRRKGRLNRKTGRKVDWTGRKADCSGRKADCSGRKADIRGSKGRLKGKTGRVNEMKGRTQGRWSAMKAETDKDPGEDDVVTVTSCIAPGCFWSGFVNKKQTGMTAKG